MNFHQYLMIFVVMILFPVAAKSQQEFYVGVGGYELCLKENRIIQFNISCGNTRIPITEVLPDVLPNVNAVTIWITRDWQEDWYDAAEIEEKFINQGYTPVFLFYWFADDISSQFVAEHEQEYYRDLKRFVVFLDKIKGGKIVILNPEFNENGIEADPDFNDLLLKSMSMVHQIADTQVSFCVGDFGQYSRINDPLNWVDFHPSIAEAVQEADFISFQEMRAITRNDQSHLRNTAVRAMAFATYLHEKYNKPTFLAYLALSSYGEDGENIQAEVLQELATLVPLQRERAGLIGVNVFHFIDIKNHQGYFNEAEKYFGLYDQYGIPKKALAAYRSLKP